MWPAVPSVYCYYVYRASNIQEVNLLKDSSVRKIPAPERLGVSPAFITDKRIFENFFYDSNVQSGTTYWYGVSVVETSGAVSPISELISVKISQQPPTVDRKECAKRALAWIEANQKAQGYWGDKPEVRMLATSQVLNALYWVNLYKPQRSIWLYRALYWLRGTFADNNDYLSRKISALGRYSQDVEQETNRLAGESVLLGKEIYGWGVTKWYGTDALSTALGVLVLRNKGFFSGKFIDMTRDCFLTYPYIFTGDSNDLLKFNLALRSKDGRYGWVPREDTSIFVSSLVYFTLGADKSVYQWILDSQKTDGAFGKGIIDTVAVLLWLPLEDTAKTQALNYLVSQQSSNGSWNSDDAYITGLCLEAILPRWWSGDWNEPWN